MKSYYCHPSESELGVGWAYLEVEGDRVIRQVQQYRDRLVWSDVSSDSDSRFPIADQLVSTMDLGSEHRIDAQEFETMWSRAMRYDDIER